jgi:hypothetical protein
VVSHVDPLYVEQHVFGDVGGVVGDSLQVPHDRQQTNCLRSETSISKLFKDNLNLRFEITVIREYAPTRAAASDGFPAARPAPR